MATTKVYAPLYAKEIEFTNGGTMLKLGGKADKIAAWIIANQNKKGYIDLCVSKRKEVGQYGDTHSVYLDTWKPKEEPSDPPTQRSPNDENQEEGALPF